MNDAYSFLVAAIPALLLAGGCVPSWWANLYPQAMGRFVVASTGMVFGLAVAAATALGFCGTLDISFFEMGNAVPLSIGVYFDSLAAVMVLLVTFIGCIISHYSVRYLDGETTQGRFMRWINFTLGAVLLLIVSRNLVMLTGAWLLTSFGLHQLLMHYADRPGAILAARKKFVISRLGDVLLIAALVLTFQTFGSFEYGAVFASAKSQIANSTTTPAVVSLIGLLYVVGAMTKSAQFPFHSWLPDTMETPTPVSALMHAGIINAGGFLVIRLSPLISLSYLGLNILALVGAITAIFGAVVMLTQTSAKRSLAYSTIAQMGFMMLQCGLGAFSAALLHIVAHSLYKAYAFLNSGSLIDSTTCIKLDRLPRISPYLSFVALLASASLAAGICVTVAWSWGVVFGQKPGALVLGLILTLAMTQLLWNAFITSNLRTAAYGILATLLISCGYYGAFVLMDNVLAQSVSHLIVPLTLMNAIMLPLLAIGFLGVFALQASILHFNQLPVLRRLYVHASNGFYLDIPAQRLTARLWKPFSQTP